MHIPSFVIILKKDESQWPKIQQRFQDAEVSSVFTPFAIWPAVNGKELSPADLSQVLTPRALYDLPRPQCSFEDISSVGAVGCFLSHRSLWQFMIERAIPEMAIFEDDVSFRHNRFLPLYHSLPEDWELFFFGYQRPPIQLQETSSKDLARGQGFFAGTQSYLINLQGAKKLLAKSLPIDTQVDTFIGVMSSNRQTSPLVCYFAKNSLTTQTRSVWNSNIQRLSGAKAILPRSPLLLLLLFVLLGAVFLLFGRKSKTCPPCVVNY